MPTLHQPPSVLPVPSPQSQPPQSSSEQRDFARAGAAGDQPSRAPGQWEAPAPQHSGQQLRTGAQHPSHVALGVPGPNGRPTQQPEPQRGPQSAQPQARPSLPPTPQVPHIAPHPGDDPPPRMFESRRPPQENTSGVSPIEPEKLANDIPRRMGVGVPMKVEIRAPRARLEAWSGGSADPHTRNEQIITKAMAMRLKAPEGGFTIEIASPETQWSEGYSGPLSDDIVSWRWTVTPTRSGRSPLQLSASTRVVGRDGLAAACPLPDQTVSVRVTPNYARLVTRLAFWVLLAGSGAMLGFYGERLFTMGRTVLAQLMR